jgi:putative addiction module component (TIGR02574 family)
MANWSKVFMMNATLATEIRRLTTVEKLQLVEELWDEIAASEDSLPVPDWHRDALAEDQARYQANPTEGSPWPEVKARLLRKL